MPSFLIFRGNNCEIIRRALERRGCWENAVVEPATDQIKELESQVEADPSNQALIEKLQRLKRSVQLKRLEAQQEAFSAGEYDFIWRPTLGIRFEGTGKVATLHS